MQEAQMLNNENKNYQIIDSWWLEAKQIEEVLCCMWLPIRENFSTLPDSGEFAVIFIWVKSPVFTHLYHLSNNLLFDVPLHICGMRKKCWGNEIEKQCSTQFAKITECLYRSWNSWKSHTYWLVVMEKSCMVMKVMYVVIKVIKVVKKSYNIGRWS